MTRTVFSRTSLCSTLAIATALVMAPKAAEAQSLQGNVTYQSGNVINVDQSVANQTTVNLNAGQSVINWQATGTPSGGITTFQGQGTTATFQSAGGDFAVLNRVDAAGNAILIDGTINSNIDGVTGGTVFFQSNDGIIIGQHASINVGSLGLTTLGIADDGNGNWRTDLAGGATSVVFNQAINAGSAIRVDNGAVIAANGSGNYVALVAPRIEHRGAIKTDGGALLLGANAATVTFRTSNLYDIQVTQGSSDSLNNGVVVDGGSIGRNDPAVGIDHRAYLVAVPANTAMTMMIQNGASLGFDVAGSAGVEGNAVVLSAGDDIASGYSNGPSAGAGTSDADIQISNSAFGSYTLAMATDFFHAGSANGLLSFSDGLAVQAARGQIDSQGATGLTDITGTLSVDVSRYGTEGESVTGGDFTLLATTGSTLRVSGPTYIYADGYGGFSGTDGLAGGNGTGGNITVQSQAGSTLDLLGYTSLSATGSGGTVNFGSSAGGSGHGGTIFVSAVGDGASTHVGAAAVFDASGYGAEANGECQSCGLSGGDGTGGNIFIDTYQPGSASVSFDQTLTANADGIGGSGNSGVSTGNATGGQARLFQTSTSGGITVTGLVTLTADAKAGSNFTNGSGGNAVGGTAFAEALGGTMSLGEATIEATATGGDGTGAIAGGGNADGGNAYVDVSNLGTTFTASSLSLDVRATAGAGESNGGAANFGVGGARNSDLSAHDGGSATVTGDVNLYSGATGGSGGNGGIGGDAIGAAAFVSGDNGGAVTIGGNLSIDSSARGGFGLDGGDGTGGVAQLLTTSGSIALNGSYLDIHANGRGGTSDGSAAGTGKGGTADIESFGTGFINVQSSASLTASGDGSDVSYGQAGDGGHGEGGSAFVNAQGGGGIHFLNTLTIDANGRGGSVTGGTAGDGKGGTATIQVNGDGSSILANYGASLSASGYGGYSSGDCNFCGGTGNNGVGGNAFIQIAGGTIGGGGNSFIANDDLTVSAEGFGSEGWEGNSGNGTGGTSGIYAIGAGSMQFGYASITADGHGAYQGNGLNAGNGTGGNARLQATVAGSDITAGTVGLSAKGLGGDADGLLGNAGNATGGFAQVLANAGTVNLTGTTTVAADATGGTGANGANGGNAVGGRTRFVVDVGGSLAQTGDLGMTATSVGGDGMNGGNGIANLGAQPRTTALTDARILSHNGTLTVTGATAIDVSAKGGAGSNGGNGGIAEGGLALIFARNGDIARGEITMATLDIDASGTGGAGGMGTSGGDAGNGGDGGSGEGGYVSTIAAAGNGTLTADSITITNRSTGGAGGDGGFSDGGTGGNGGTGGAALGSRTTTFGTESGSAEAAGQNSGLFDVNTVAVDATATGGNGGSGSFGSTVGLGGNGGEARSPGAYLNGAGGTIIIDTVNVGVDANGGNAGYDSDDGLTASGGNAIAGGGGFNLSSRAFGGALRNTTMIGTFNTVGVATGGNGGIMGTSTVQGFSVLQAADSDVTFGNFLLSTTGADGATTNVFEDPMYLQNSTVTVTGDYTIIDDALVSVVLDNSILTASNFTIDAGNFIPTSLGPPLTSVGLIDAGSVSLASGQDIIVDANIQSGSDLFLNVPGLVSLQGVDVTGFFGSISGGGFQSAAIDTTTGVAIDAASISTGPIGSTGGAIALHASTGDINTGDLTAKNSVGATADLGAISTGAINAASTNLSAAGNVTASGAILTGPLSVSGANLSLQSIQAQGAILTATGDVTTLGITSFGTLTIGAAGNAQVGAINADGIDITGNDINGAGMLSTAYLTLTANHNASVGNLSASGDVTLFAANDLTAGPVSSSGGQVTATAGLGALSLGNVSAINHATFAGATGVTLGSVTSGQRVRIDSGGGATTQAITAGDTIEINAVNNIATGNLSAGIVNPSSAPDAEYNIGLDAGGSVATGTVQAAANAGIAAIGSIQTGNIDVGGGFLGLGHGAMTFGAINAGADVYLADQSMMALGGNIGGPGGFDPLPILTATPVLSNGPITINGNVSAGRFAAGAGGNFTASGITADGGVRIAAGGAISVGTISSGDRTKLHAGSTINAANITSGDTIEADSPGNITLGNLNAGLTLHSNAIDAEYNIGINSGGSVQTGSIDAFNSSGIAAIGTIQTGAINVGDIFLGLGHGAMTFASITAGGPVLLADQSMMALGGQLGGGSGVDFDPAPVLAATPVASNGPITITGNASAQEFKAASGGAFNAGNIQATAGNVEIYSGGATTAGAVSASGLVSIVADGGSLALGSVSAAQADVSSTFNVNLSGLNVGSGSVGAGGLLTINGNWSAGDLALRSSDITNLGTIDSTGTLSLISTNPNATVFGDNYVPQGGGYVLGQAELNGMHAPLYTFAADTGRGAAPTMVLGDLTLAASGNAVDPFYFVIGNAQAGTVGGTIKIVGDVVFTGLQPGYEVGFESSLFELDSATGSLALTGSGNTIQGNLYINAQQAWIADGSVLSQIEAGGLSDAQLAGLLAAPSSTPHPNGVISASDITIDLTDYNGLVTLAVPQAAQGDYSVYVQNTGTSDLPAGFFANSATVTSPQNDSSALVDLIVNGQVQTQSGILTGADVRDFFMADDDPARFTTRSTINGCALSGTSCGQVAPPPPPPPPTPDIATEIVLLDNNVLDDPSFGNEDVISDPENQGEDEDKDESDDGATSPIEPPVPLFDARALGSKDETDEPVSGGGNPALMGNGPAGSDKESQ